MIKSMLDEVVEMRTNSTQDKAIFGTEYIQVIYLRITASIVLAIVLTILVLISERSCSV